MVVIEEVNVDKVLGLTEPEPDRDTLLTTILELGRDILLLEEQVDPEECVVETLELVEIVVLVGELIKVELVGAILLLEGIFRLEDELYVLQIELVVVL